MTIKWPLLLSAGLALAACEPVDHHGCDPPPAPAPAPAPVTIPGNRVLMVKVDYLTNTFEGGTELTFPSTTPTFTISNQYDPPGDFGNVQLRYQELSQPLFDGSIIWMGCGQMQFPQGLTPAAEFDRVTTPDVVTPAAGFENVFNPSSQTYSYTPVWQAVQNLTRVRAYLAANPQATVKLFLYTPSVGMGNPADWDWILFLKN